MNNENETQDKLNFYIEQFEKARDRVGDDQAAAAIMQEAAKDRRTNQMQRERGTHGEQPATQKQLDYLARMGAVIPANLTKLEASHLIDEALAWMTSQAKMN